MYTPKPRKLPSGKYNVRLRLDGESISITESTAQEAIRKARLVKSEYLAGKRERQQSEACLSLREGIDLYLKDRPKLSPATIRKYRNIQANHWDTIMDSRMDRVTPRQWQAAVAAMQSRYAAKTVKVSWGMIGSVLSACGVVAPGIKIQRSSAEKALDIDKCKFLEPDEIKKFVGEAVKSKYCIPLLLALSSLRIAEIDGLQWDHIVKGKDGYVVKVRQVRIQDEDQKWVLKPGAKTDGSVRDVPVFIPQLVAALDRVERKDGKVMRCCQEALRRNCQKVCDAAGVPCPGVHGLRHSFASLCASPQVGIPAPISQEIGGWENDKIMKEIYTHVAKQDMQAALQKLTDFYSKPPE